MKVLGKNIHFVKSPCIQVDSVTGEPLEYSVPGSQYIEMKSRILDFEYRCTKGAIENIVIAHSEMVIRDGLKPFSDVYILYIGPHHDVRTKVRYEVR